MLRRFFCKAVLKAVAAGAVLAVSSVLLAQGRSEQALERVIEIQERNTDRLMAIQGVVGTAVGLNPGGQFAVAVLLESPGVGGIPQQLEGVPVHPVVTGKIYALPRPEGRPDKKPPPSEPPVDPTDRLDRPVPIGVSTGHPDITAGTIGCRVTKGLEVFALSNNHVYADENRATAANDGYPGDPVIQPGTYDGGSSPADDIGTLAAYVPLTFGGINYVDAAIAEITEDAGVPRVGKSTPADGYGTPKSDTLSPADVLGMRVQKYGRTTRLTKGRVVAINAAVNVGYDSGVALFVGQIVVSPGSFSAGGDSGSLIVANVKGGDNLKPVGLLFAGSPSYTIANPIDAVLDAFGVMIDGQ